MSVFDRLGLILWRAGPRREWRRAALLQAERWAEARRREPRLAEDLMTIGRVLTLTPRAEDGQIAADALQLAHEAGRRELAIELLAMMGLQHGEVQALMMEDARDAND